MDMSKTYIASVKKYLPKASIVFDRFHVTKVLTSMVDEVRKREWKKYQQMGLSVGKGERFRCFWNCATRAEGASFLLDWCVQATWSGIKELDTRWLIH